MLCVTNPAQKTPGQPLSCRRKSSPSSRRPARIGGGAGLYDRSRNRAKINPQKLPVAGPPWRTGLDRMSRSGIPPGDRRGKGPEDLHGDVLVNQPLTLGPELVERVNERGVVGEAAVLPHGEIHGDRLVSVLVAADLIGVGPGLDEQAALPAAARFQGDGDRRLVVERPAAGDRQESFAGRSGAEGFGDDLVVVPLEVEVEAEEEVEPPRSRGG